VTPFATVTIPATLGIVDGVVVSIEKGYSVGSDVLTYLPTPPAGITVEWRQHIGALVFRGVASAAAYQPLVSQVIFFTTSNSTDNRVITWNLGLNTVASSVSGYMFKYFYSSASVAWDQANALCKTTQHLGMTGRLASVGSATDNLIMSNKLLAEGWLAGRFSGSTNLWSWTTTSTPFWMGGSTSTGGLPYGRQYSNWQPAGIQSQFGEPLSVPGLNYSMFLVNGFWAARTPDSARGFAYICQYGLDSAVPTGSWGTATLARSGCVGPENATIPAMCATYTDSTACAGNPECMWNSAGTGSCVMGCAFEFDPSACRARSECHLNTQDFVPAVCQPNLCAPTSACTNAACSRDSQGLCQYNTGCSQYTASSTCGGDKRCSWNAATSTCAKSITCADYQQSQPTCVGDCLSQCRTDTSCSVVSNATSSVCAPATCTYADSTACTSDPQCTSKTATGSTFSSYAAPKAVLGSVTTTAAATTGFIVTITSGFQPAGDFLSFAAANAPGFSATYDSAHGVLTVFASGAVDAAATTTALQNVLFATTSSSTAPRTFSWAFMNGQTRPVYIDAGSKFVEFVTNGDVMYGAATSLCAGRTYFGSAGSLLAIGSAAEQASITSAVAGPTAWIGGEGAHALPSVDVWTWPNNAIFYRGSAAIGSSPDGAYANWAAGQPSAVVTGGLLFAQITASGKWTTALANAGGTAGFMCSYAVNPTTMTGTFGSVTVTASGCFPNTLCVYGSQQACETDARCAFVGGKCAATTCAAGTTVSACNQLPGCYFDATAQACTVQKVNPCATVSTSSCSSVAGCSAPATSGGSCVATGCIKYLDAASCGNDPTCAIGNDGLCRAKVCGFTSQTDCLTQGGSLCAWNSTTASCAASTCVAASSPSQCGVGCTWNDNMAPKCSTDSCGGVSETTCKSVTGCMWNGAKCTLNVCPILNSTTCGQTPGCAISKADSTVCTTSA